MPKISQKIDILFKKFLAGKSTTNRTGQRAWNETGSNPGFEFFQEPLTSIPRVEATQIMSQSSLISKLRNPLNPNRTNVLPGSATALGAGEAIINTGTVTVGTRTYNTTISGTVGPDTFSYTAPILTVNGLPVLQRILIPLVFVPTSNITFSYPSNDPLIFADSTAFLGSQFSPNAQLYPVKIGTLNYFNSYASNTTAYLAEGNQDWFFDQDSLTINFFAEAGNPAFVSGTAITSGSGASITSSINLWVECYRYIGAFGFEAVSAGGGSGGTGNDWQNAILGFTSAFSAAGPGTVTVFDNPGLTGTASSALGVVNGTRFVYQGASAATGVNLYNPTTSSYSSGPVSPGTILEWYDSAAHSIATSAWVAFAPPAGTIVTVLGLNTQIYRWTGSTWISQKFEQTYTKNIAGVPIDTISPATVSDFSIFSSTQINDSLTPSCDVFIYINGVKLNKNCWTALSLAFTTDTGAVAINGNSFTAGNQTYVVGDAVQINGSILRNVSAVSGTTITYLGAAVTATSVSKVVKTPLAAPTAISYYALNYVNNSGIVPVCGFQIDSTDSIEFAYEAIS